MRFDFRSFGGERWALGPGLSMDPGKGGHASRGLPVTAVHLHHLLHCVMNCYVVLLFHMACGVITAALSTPFGIGSVHPEMLHRVLFNPDTGKSFDWGLGFRPIWMNPTESYSSIRTRALLWITITGHCRSL